MDTMTLLEREMYSEPEAARLLGVPPRALNYWLEGKRVGSKTYKPVIRLEPKGKDAAVTWAEFVEARLLREYRKDLGVRMADLRGFIERLREEFGVPYPLAHRRPYASGRDLVMTAQEAANLPGELWLVTRAANQFLLTPPSESFLRRAKWHGDQPVALHVADDSPVLIDPDVRFGRPSVNGISTAVIWEHADDGESDEEIAQTFGLAEADVVWALAYEKPRHLPVEAKSA